MRTIYKIERHQPENYCREDAVKAFRNLRIMRQASGAFVYANKQTGAFSNVLDGIKRKMLDMKTAYRQAISGRAERWTIQRLDHAFEKRPFIPFDPALRVYVLRQIRNSVQTVRANRKRTRDPLAEREPLTILRRYQSTILSKTKGPTEATAEYIGIEIECITKRNADMGALLPFAKWVNVGADGSITHDDGEEGREIRVCLKRDELKTVVPEIMAALNSIGARVNRSCGLHVHLDQRTNPTPELTFQKLVRSLGLLYTVVPKSRRENTYCKRNLRTSFQSHDRYKAINSCAYRRYKTLEVRLFGGTLNAEKVINWIETLEAISHGEMVNRCPKNFDTARKYWTGLSDENVACLKARQAQFSPALASAPTAESDTDTTTADGEAFAAENADGDAPTCRNCDGIEVDCSCDEFVPA